MDHLELPLEELGKSTHKNPPISLSLWHNTGCFLLTLIGNLNNVSYFPRFPKTTFEKRLFLFFVSLFDADVVFKMLLTSSWSKSSTLLFVMGAFFYFYMFEFCFFSDCDETPHVRLSLAIWWTFPHSFWICLSGTKKRETVYFKFT